MNGLFRLNVCIGIKGCFCASQNAHRALARRPRIPAWLINAIVSKPTFWLSGLLSGLSVLIEAKHRRGELAMYVLPKGLESAWAAARGKGLVFRTGKHGNALVSIFVPWGVTCTDWSLVDCYWDGNGHGALSLLCSPN
jgi:hypothetical protein